MLLLRATTYIGFLCLAISMLGCSKPVVQQVDVCDVLASPTDFDEQTIRLTAFADMRRHGTVLVGPSCQENVIGIEPVDGSVDLANFYRSVSTSLPPDGKVVPVILEGRFKFYPAAYPGHMLYVTKVIKITPVSNKPSGR